MEATLIAIAAEGELAERRAQLGQLAKWHRHHGIETQEAAVASRGAYAQDLSVIVNSRLGSLQPRPRVFHPYRARRTLA